jgi:drug/metabolite transporter (DMT)-like permease
MNKDQTSFFEKAYNPVLQAAVIFGAGVAVTLLSKIVKATGLIEVSQTFPWMSAAAFMLFFAMFNSIFSLSSKNMMQYWGRSIYSFLGLAAASGLMAYLFSSLSINEAGSYRWIYFVLTIGYLVFLSMMATLKRIVEFAQKEEWNHPRIRHKPKQGNRDIK